VLCLALGLVGFFTPAALADDKNEDKGKAVRVVLKSIQVAPTKPDGSAWDINDGKPDLQVRIKNNTDTSIKEFLSPEKTDTFDASFDAPTILAMPGQELLIEVLDKDVAVEDAIGRTTIKLTEEMLKKGSHEMTFNQVKSMKLEFTKP